MKLNELRENPNNPSKCSEQELERLAGKLKRVPLGLTAMRIAYITDDPDGGKMVISGNKRLRVLKRAYGDDAELPDEYFQDVTAMSEAERHEFIVSANVSDGEWDLDMLLQQYAFLHTPWNVQNAALITVVLNLQRYLILWKFKINFHGFQDQCDIIVNVLFKVIFK